MAVDAKRLAELRRVYSDIVCGYSTLLVDGKTVYIRHFSPVEQAEMDSEYVTILEDAKDRGMLEESQRLAQIKSEKLWTDADELEICNYKNEISQLRDTKNCLFIPSQVEQIEASISAVQEKLSAKTEIRADLLGTTAEIYSMSKLNQFYIYSMMFKNRELSERFYSLEEFEELDRPDIVRLTILYNNCIKTLSAENLKKLAVVPFFLSYYALCDKNAFYFFGRAIAKLTFYQVELMDLGKTFYSLLTSEDAPPKDLLDDPDAIINWYNVARNAKQVLSNTAKGDGGGAVSIAGASKTDIEKMGLNLKVANPAGEAKKLGKTTLSSEEMDRLGL